MRKDTLDGDVGKEVGRKGKVHCLPHLYMCTSWANPLACHSEYWGRRKECERRGGLANYISFIVHYRPYLSTSFVPASIFKMVGTILDRKGIEYALKLQTVSARQSKALDTSCRINKCEVMEYGMMNYRCLSVLLKLSIARLIHLVWNYGMASKIVLKSVRVWLLSAKNLRRQLLLGNR